MDETYQLVAELLDGSKVRLDNHSSNLELLFNECGETIKSRGYFTYVNNLNNSCFVPISAIRRIIIEKDEEGK